MNTLWAKKATTVAVLGCAGVLALGGVASAVDAPPVGHAVTQDDPNPNPGPGADNGTDKANCPDSGKSDAGSTTGTPDGAANGDAGTDDPNATAPDGSGSSDNCAPDHDGNAPAAAPDDANAPVTTPDNAGSAGSGTDAGPGTYAGPGGGPAQ